MPCTTWLSLLLLATVFIMAISCDEADADVYDNREIKSEGIQNIIYYFY